nr:hypothetical protein [Tanacetum cinerariifolium]
MAKVNLPNHARGDCFSPYKDFFKRHTSLDSNFPQIPEGVHIDFLLKFSMQEGICHVKLMERPSFICSYREENSDCINLGYKRKRLGIIDPISLSGTSLGWDLFVQSLPRCPESRSRIPLTVMMVYYGDGGDEGMRCHISDEVEDACSLRNGSPMVGDIPFNQQTSAVTIAMTAMLKQFQSNPPIAQVKAVEEICVTCGGAHPYYQCLAAGGNTFPEY